MVRATKAGAAARARLARFTAEVRVGVSTPSALDYTVATWAWRASWQRRALVIQPCWLECLLWTWLEPSAMLWPRTPIGVPAWGFWRMRLRSWMAYPCDAECQLKLQGGQRTGCSIVCVAAG